MSTEPRFYVREHSGYAIALPFKTGGGHNLVTEVSVIDRAYCHRVVRSFNGSVEYKFLWAPIGARVRGRLRSRLEARRLAAATYCAELNGE